jgi:preprotein translocase subunit SecG
MTTLIIGIILFLSVLSILIVLAQNSKGGGLSSQFGGSGASNIIGVKRTGDLLEKLTWGFMIAIMVLSLSTNLVDTRTGGPTNEILEKAGEQQTPLNLPPAQTPTPIVVDSTDGQ